MVNGAFGMFARSRDLRFERGDAPVELGDRKRVEILTREQRHRISRAGRWRDVVGVHGSQR